MPQIEIYTVDWCGYCRAAERFFERRGVAFTNIDVTDDAPKRAWLAETTGQATVPQIFIDGRSIGGYSDLKALDAQGGLAQLLGG